jgi:hypothetical protein
LYSGGRELEDLVIEMILQELGVFSSLSRALAKWWLVDKLGRSPLQPNIYFLFDPIHLSIHPPIAEIHLAENLMFSPAL